MNINPSAINVPGNIHGISAPYSKNLSNLLLFLCTIREITIAIIVAITAAKIA
ncbi:Uncharacterised protein [Streptococcus pneumoniae]|nr:Uncharacterised protein [Streptococcus pneumoniae]CJH13807.1 Uncharacterised protein [Streptococcus pneumoniae]CKL99271.1 Uncharacterised protein [Streptococcus pneumoniae]CMV66407.1 Uncharacterised protein [Streptococcus pneumoniae]CRG01460.1 Uncharacterised protein [Streptococcus pneumoniae]